MFRLLYGVNFKNLWQSGVVYKRFQQLFRRVQAVSHSHLKKISLFSHVLEVINLIGVEFLNKASPDQPIKNQSVVFVVVY